LGGISLFDFSTDPIDRIFEHLDRWHQFLGCASPTTVVLGMPKSRLQGELVPYPKNRDLTPTALGPIPFVEVCHIGAIPTSAIASCLIVSARNYSRFQKLECGKLDGISFKDLLAKFESSGELQNSDVSDVEGRIREFNRSLDASRNS